MENSSCGSFFKRLNLLLLLVVAIGSIGTGIYSAKQMYYDEVYKASEVALFDVPPTKAELQVAESEWIDDATFARMLKEDEARIKAAKEKRLSEISISKYVSIGLGIGFGTLALFILLVMTISWLLGYKFRLHVSTK